MWTVKQNVFLILNSVPATLVTDPEFIRPSVPVIAHFLNQEVVASYNVTMGFDLEPDRWAHQLAGYFQPT